eukprot:7060725-Prymnesium_polylepis.1
MRRVVLHNVGAQSVWLHVRHVGTFVSETILKSRHSSVRWTRARTRKTTSTLLSALRSFLPAIAEAALGMDLEASIAELRCVVGEGPSDSTLRALLARSGGDVAGAANAFFDGSVAEMSESAGGGGSGGSRAGDDVLATLFKTLEDVGRKLAGARRASGR